MFFFLIFITEEDKGEDKDEEYRIRVLLEM